MRCTHAKNMAMYPAEFHEALHGRPEVINHVNFAREQHAQFDHDRIDRAIARRLMRAVSADGDLHSQRALSALLQRGWSYTAMLGALLHALDASEEDERGESSERHVSYVVLAPGREGSSSNKHLTVDDEARVAHALLATYLFGRTGFDALQDVDPRGVLSQRTGRWLYARQRLNGGTPRLWVHPAAHDYVRALLAEHRGGAAAVAPNIVVPPPHHLDARPDCIIGKGKAGSYVLSAMKHCLRAVAPSAKTFCLKRYAAAASTGHVPEQFCGGIMELNAQLQLVAKSRQPVVLKINGRDSDTQDEYTANQYVHAWLKRRNFLHLTPFDKELCIVHAQDASGKTVQRLLVMRSMLGDVDRIKLTLIELASIAMALLIVLNIIHEHSYLHMDIKPANILHEWVDREHVFVVADYGIMSDMQTVHHNLKLGKFSGTYGHMSPLLLPTGDDTDNKVYPKFIAAAQMGSGIEYTPDDIVHMVEQYKSQLDNTTLPKVDLHSVGLTLMTLLEKNCTEPQNSRARREFWGFIESLLFFQPVKHFQNTYQALKALCRKFPVATCNRISMQTIR